MIYVMYSIPMHKAVRNQPHSWQLNYLFFCKGEFHSYSPSLPPPLALPCRKFSPIIFSLRQTKSYRDYISINFIGEGLPKSHYWVWVLLLCPNVLPEIKNRQGVASSLWNMAKADKILFLKNQGWNVWNAAFSQFLLFSISLCHLRYCNTPERDRHTDKQWHIEKQTDKKTREKLIYWQ